MVLSFATEETALSSFQKPGSTEFKAELLGSGEEMGSFNSLCLGFPRAIQDRKWILPHRDSGR